MMIVGAVGCSTLSGVPSGFQIPPPLPFGVTVPFPTTTHAPIQTNVPGPVDSKALFRTRFQWSLRQCVRRRFSVAECFGVIWEETLEEIALSDQEQSELYEELIDWAKGRLFRELIEARTADLCT